MRETEGEGSPEAGGSSSTQALPGTGQVKRLRVSQGHGEVHTSQQGGVSESGCVDVEYQVPTSSQRESEYDTIAIDSDDSAEVEEGIAEQFDDEQEEDDNGEDDGGYDMMVDDDGRELGAAFDEEGDVGHDIDDEDNNVAASEDNNEVEVDEGGDSNERPQQSGGNNSNSGGEVPRNSDQAIDMSTSHHHHDQQQIQMISSGIESSAAVAGPSGSSSGTLSDESSSAAVATQSNQALWRPGQAGAASTSQRQHPGLNPQLVLQGQGQTQQQSQPEETGDDCIVPSTPNLFAQRRHVDGSEAMSSPHPQVPHATQFTFNESSTTPASGVVSGGGVATSGRTGSTSLVPGGGNLEGIDDTQIDLSTLNESGTPGGRTVPNTPKLISSPSTMVVPQAGPSTGSDGAGPSGTSAAEVNLVEDTEQHQMGAAVPGPSQGATDVPTIAITVEDDDEEDEVDIDEEPESDGTEHQNATTSQQSTSSSSTASTSARGKTQDEGTDGVSSEGEKPQSGAESAVEMEEGREAEASLTPTMNTRSRASMQQQSPPMRGRGRGGAGGRGRTPIVWGDAQRGGNARGGGNMRMQQQQQMQMQQQQQQQQHMMHQQQMQMSPQQIPSFQQQQQQPGMMPQQPQPMNTRGARGRRARGRPPMGGGNFRY